MDYIFSNHAKSVPYFLVLKGKIKGHWPLYCTQRCAVTVHAHHFTTDLPIPTKICSSIYYNRIVDWNLYEKWPDFGTTPLWLLNCSRINLSLWITRQSSSLNTGIEGNNTLGTFTLHAKFWRKICAFSTLWRNLSWEFQGRQKILTSEIKLLNPRRTWTNARQQINSACKQARRERQGTFAINLLSGLFEIIFHRLWPNAT